MTKLLSQPVHHTAHLLLLLPHLALLKLILCPLANQLELRIAYNQRMAKRRASIETIVAWGYGRRLLRTLCTRITALSRCPLLIRTVTVLALATAVNNSMISTIKN